MKNHKEIYIQMLMIGQYLVLNGVENHDNPKGIKHRSNTKFCSREESSRPGSPIT